MPLNMNRPLKPVRKNEEEPKRRFKKAKAKEKQMKNEKKGSKKSGPPGYSEMIRYEREGPL